MFWHKREDKSYQAVALAVIFAGAVVFVFGAMGWWINVGADENVVAFPSLKIMGGLVIMALGYIQLELGLLRRK